MSRFWIRLKVALAYALMESKYEYCLHVVDEANSTVIVVWALDKRTYERNFSHVPRYHTAQPTETVQ